MELNHLRVFFEVAKVGRFTRGGQAAEHQSVGAKSVRRAFRRKRGRPAFARCQKLNADLWGASDNAMGGRWSSELICYKDSIVIGGIKGTYQQGQIDDSSDN